MLDILWYAYVVVGILVGFGVLVVVLEALGIRPDRHKREKRPYGYVLRKSFLTKNEQAFYAALCEAAAPQYPIFAQVRLADIFAPKARDRSAYTTALNRITSKHVDFLLCDHALMPIAGIELDDRSHGWKNRQQRDAFVNEVFQEAHLPLIRFQGQSRYYAKDVKESLQNKLRLYAPKPPADIPCADSVVKRGGRG